MKLSIQKQTAEGELVMAEVELLATSSDGVTEDQIREAVTPVFRVLDERLLEMNLRIIKSNKAVKALSPEAQMAVHQVVEVLYGRRPQSPEQVLAALDPADTDKVQAAVEEAKGHRDNIVQFGARSKKADK